MSLNKLKFDTTTALLEAYPEKKIKQLLNEMEASDLIKLILDQNPTDHIVNGLVRDQEASDRLALMSEEVRKHVEYLADHGTGRYSSGIPKLSPTCNLMQVLWTAFSGLSPTSALQCSYEWNAMLMRELPHEMALVDKLNDSRSITVFEYKDKAQLPEYRQLTMKTRRTAQEQQEIFSELQELKSKSRVTNEQMDRHYRHYEGTPISAGDVFYQKFPRYSTLISIVLSKMVLVDEAVRNQVAELMHPVEISAALAANCTKHPFGGNVDSAAMSYNYKLLSDASTVIEQKKAEEAALAKEAEERAKAEAAHRKQEEANFSEVLKKEQRLLVLADKVKAGTINLDEMKEYRELR